MKSTYIWTIVGVGVIAGVVYLIPGGEVGNVPVEQKTVVTNTTDTAQTQKVETKEVVKEAINENKPVTKMTELKIEDSVVGGGTEAKAGDSVTVHYVGSLTNGKVFDASKNHGNNGFTFTLGAGQVIKGWDLGVAGMKVGGKRKLSIPSALAYGDQAIGGGLIPANSDLIFEVELLKVGQ